MSSLNVRTDADMERALQALSAQKGSRTEAVRYALLRTYRETVDSRLGPFVSRFSADEDHRARPRPDAQARSDLTLSQSHGAIVEE